MIFIGEGGGGGGGGYLIIFFLKANKMAQFKKKMHPQLINMGLQKGMVYNIHTPKNI